MSIDQDEKAVTDNVREQENASRALVVRGELSHLPEPLQDKIFALHRRIALLLERRQGSVVQFASTQHEREGSKIVLELAKLTAQRLDRKILLFAIGPVPYALPNGAGRPSSDESWENAVRSGMVVEEHIHAIEGTSLSFCQIGSSTAVLPAILDNPRFDVFVNLLRSRFDMVLVDCPSMADSTIAARIASISDGVVLIVDAGKVRWQVIKNQIREIQANRGSVLGVVLNKRKFYIPEFIYKRL
jgi:Mrp family chromosome partitioning ATPase